MPPDKPKFNVGVMRRSVNSIRDIFHLVEWVNPPEDARMLEVGSYAGESAQLFAVTQRFVSITCVDPWSFGYTTVAEPLFNIRAKECGLHKMKMPSLKAAALIGDASLDLVYLDGAHDYDSVMADIRAWRPKVKPGGVLAGHDLAHEDCPGVTRAVIETFRDSHSGDLFYPGWNANLSLVPKEQYGNVMPQSWAVRL